MLDCEGDIRVGRSGCQRQGKELQLFVLPDQAWAAIWDWWEGNSTGLPPPNSTSSVGSKPRLQNAPFITSFAQIKCYQEICFS